MKNFTIKESPEEVFFLIQEKKFSPFPITIFCTFYEPKFETMAWNIKKRLKDIHMMFPNVPHMLLQYVIMK